MAHKRICLAFRMKLSKRWHFTRRGIWWYAKRCAPGSVGFASLLPSDENRCGGFIHCCKGVSDSQSAIIALGGKAAVEMRYAGQVAEGCSDDIARAVNCIREAAAKEGALGFSLLNVESDSSSNMSESLNARSEAAVQAELERYYGKARALLAQNEAFLKEITEALVMKKTLLYSDIQAIRGTAVKRNPAVTCETASRYDAAEIENFPLEDPEEAMRPEDHAQAGGGGATAMFLMLQERAVEDKSVAH